MQVVDAQDRFGIGEQVFLRQEIADLPGHHRRPPLTAADIDGKAEFAGSVALHFIADVVELDRRPVARRAGDGDLELARQEQEFRMQ